MNLGDHCSKRGVGYAENFWSAYDIDKSLYMLMHIQHSSGKGGAVIF